MRKCHIYVYMNISLYILELACLIPPAGMGAMVFVVSLLLPACLPCIPAGLSCIPAGVCCLDICRKRLLPNVTNDKAQNTFNVVLIAATGVFVVVSIVNIIEMHTFNVCFIVAWCPLYIYMNICMCLYLYMGTHLCMWHL